MKKDREVSKSGIGLKNRRYNIRGGVSRGTYELFGMAVADRDMDKDAFWIVHHSFFADEGQTADLKKENG